MIADPGVFYGSQDDGRLGREAARLDLSDVDGPGAGRERLLAGAKVLLVEDEFVIALDFQILLYRFGCEVLGPVGSVAEALVILRHERPDVALLDVNLRDGLVVPVAERLAAMAVPFLLVTARDSRRLAEPLLQQAPSLGKPVDERELLRSLARLMGPGAL
jgi:two-component system, response regulator PdtaR